MVNANDDASVSAYRHYKLNPEGFSDVQRNILIRIAVAAPFLLAAVWYFDLRTKPHRDVFDFIFLPTILLIVVYRLLKTQRANWQSLDIALSHDEIIRKLPRYPDLHIPLSEVREIVDSPAGVVVKANSVKTLVVSKHLIDYGEFCSSVKERTPQATFVPARRRSVASLMWTVLSIPGCLVMFGSPLYLMYTPHRELVLPLGIAILIAYLAMIIYSLRSPHVPTSFRYTAWILLALPLYPIIERLVQR